MLFAKRFPFSGVADIFFLIMDDYLSYCLGIEMLNFPNIALNILILFCCALTADAKASIPGNFKLFFGFPGIFFEQTKFQTRPLHVL